MRSLTVLEYLRHFTGTVLLAVGALLPIVNPLGGAPIYLAMTSDLKPERRGAMAKAVALNSFLLLIASTFVGAYVLDFFGLSIPAVQVAGGIVVCGIAWALLNNPNSPATMSRTTLAENEAGQDAFYPLTMPLTVGPGSISVALTLGANPEQGMRPLVVTTLAHLLGMLFVAVSIYLCYRYADRILEKVGSTGTAVVVRLSAFILLCIGVQISWNGIHALLASAFPAAIP